MDRGPDLPSSPTFGTPHPVLDSGDSSCRRPSTPGRAAHPPGYHGRNPCSNARWDQPGSGPGHDATRYASGAGPAYAAAIRRTIQPSNALAIHRPSFALQQHQNPQVSKPWTAMGKIADAYPQRGLILRPTAAIPGGPTELCQATGPQATHLKRLPKPLGEFPAACGP